MTIIFQINNREGNPRLSDWHVKLTLSTQFHARACKITSCASSYSRSVICITLEIHTLYACKVLKMLTIKTKDYIMHNFIYRDRHTGQMIYVYVYKQLYQYMCVYISMHKDIHIACRVENKYNTAKNTSIGFSRKYMHMWRNTKTHLNM